jgi:hypothetical protein
MSRLSSFAIVIASIAAASGAAYAQSQAELAEKLNEEGKELMYANKYPEASAKFRQAVARVAEPKYFFNLCVSLTNEGALNEAFNACTSAQGNATGELSTKTDKMITKIRDLAKSQGKELGGGGSTDTPPQTPDRPVDHPPAPAHPDDPTHQPPPTRVGETDHPMTAPPIRYAPPDQNLALASTPDNHYTWTLGIDLLAGGGKLGQPDVYGTAAVGFRLKSDYLFDPIHRFGGEGYIQYSHLGKAQNDTLDVSTLDVIDVGAALYKHFCLGGRLCVTPLAGVHLSLMSPAGEMDDQGGQLFNYAAVGGRAEIALSYAFGPRFENVLSIMGGVNVYSAVISGPGMDSDNLTAAEVGLDKGGALGYFAIGYTRRFNTPLGGRPFITLE